MLARRLAALGSAVCLLLPTAGSAADLGGRSDGDLKVSWSVQPQTREVTAVCGNVFNQRRMSARGLRILVESLDANDRVLSARDASSARDLSPLGGVPFCVTMPTGANSYRVRINSIIWDEPVGQ